MERTSRFASETFIQFDEDNSDETARTKIMIKGLLAGIGLDAVGPDIYIGLVTDLGKHTRYQSGIAVEPTSSVPPQLAGILDGPSEGIIIKFHET